MVETVKELCANIQNCVLGYTQSDEITLVLLDDFKDNTSTWFDNQVEKICSVAASIVTRAFNHAVYKLIYALEYRQSDFSDEKLIEFWSDKLFRAEFAARCFNVPNRMKAYNNLVWRQQDAIKNSITMVALAHFSQKEIQGKSGKEKITMLAEKGIRWNELCSYDKQGIVIKKETYEKNGAIRTACKEDFDTPVFTQNPDYIFNILNKEEEDKNVTGKD